MNDPTYLALIPFLVPATLTDGYSMGRGIIRFVTIGAANADITVKHNLGRIPPFVLLLDPGSNYVMWRRGTAAWTNTTVTLQFSATGSVKIWIV